MVGNLIKVTFWFFYSPPFSPSQALWFSENVPVLGLAVPKSFFQAMEKYSNAVKHVSMFIFLIGVVLGGEMEQAEKGLVVVRCLENKHLVKC